MGVILGGKDKGFNFSVYSLVFSCLIAVKAVFFALTA